MEDQWTSGPDTGTVNAERGLCAGHTVSFLPVAQLRWSVTTQQNIHAGVKISAVAEGGRSV